MKTLKSLLFVAIACLALSACQSKESTLQDFRNLSASVSANSDNYSADDWKLFLSEFAKADSILNTYELTEEERAEVKKIKNACSKYVFKGKAVVKAQEVKDAINGAINDAVDNVNGAIQNATDQAKDALNSLKGENK